MSPDYFQKELSKIAPDLRLLYIPEDKLYWVCQLRGSYSGVVMPDNRNTEAFYRLFPIKPENGKEFRYPDERDLRVAMQAVMEGQKMWKNAHAYMKQLDLNKERAQAKQREEHLDLITEIGKDVKKSNNIKIWTGR